MSTRVEANEMDELTMADTSFFVSRTRTASSHHAISLPLHSQAIRLSTPPILLRLYLAVVERVTLRLVGLIKSEPKLVE
jgi:hypothetical protein